MNEVGVRMKFPLQVNSVHALSRVHAVSRVDALSRRVRDSWTTRGALRRYLGVSCAVLLSVVGCNSGDNVAEPIVVPSSGSVTSPVLPPDPGIFEPPTAGQGKGPNPDTVISANPTGCKGSGETYPGGELNSCYRVVTLPVLSWAQASIDCSLWSAGRGHLVAVTSAGEAEYVRSIAAGATVWLGAGDAKAEGEWQWLSGETWFFQNFATGRPDNRDRSEHCLSLDSDGTWDDRACDQTLPYICERPYTQ